MADVDYGPLAALIGTWKGDRGMDVAPEPDGGLEKSPYYETIIFEAGGDLTNAKQQHLAIVTYTQIVTRKATDEVFHHQYGYWLYDAAEGTVMQSVSIPRAVMVLAGGKAVQTGGEVVIEVSAEAGKLDFGVLQSPFMERNAKTTAFTHKLTVKDDQLQYVECTSLNIYDKHFDHTDENTLTRVTD